MVEKILAPLRSEPEAKLAIIQVGNVPEDNSYLKQVRNTLPKIPNLSFQHVPLPLDTTEVRLREEMFRLNDDP